MTEAITWKNGDRLTLCVLQNLDRRASIDDFGTTQGATGEATQKLKITFPAPVKGLRVGFFPAWMKAAPVKGLINERTGEAMGDGREFEDDYSPWGANVYTYSP